MATTNMEDPMRTIAHMLMVCFMLLIAVPVGQVMAVDHDIGQPTIEAPAAVSLMATMQVEQIHAATTAASVEQPLVAATFTTTGTASHSAVTVQGGEALMPSIRTAATPDTFARSYAADRGIRQKWTYPYITQRSGFVQRE